MSANQKTGEKMTSDSEVSKQTPTFWAYLAGLIDGDGCIEAGSRLRKDGRIDRKARVSLSMSDLDVLEDVMRRTGVGHIYPDRSTSPGRGTKQMWRWQVDAREDVRIILNAIQWYVGARRYGKLNETLMLIARWNTAATHKRKG